jgi:hypothetical protein
MKHTMIIVNRRVRRADHGNRHPPFPFNVFHKMLLLSCFVFFLPITCSAQTEPTPACANCSGNPWTDNFGDRWTLDTSSGGSVTGTLVGVIGPGCPNINYSSVGGTYNKNTGALSNLIAANPSPASYPGCSIASTITFNGSISNVGCNTGSGSWSNSLGQGGNWTWSKACDHPDGESTNYNMWLDQGGFSPNWPTAYAYWAQVTADRDFQGQVVYEEGVAGGTDSCFHNGDPYPAFTGPASVFGNAWNIGRIGTSYPYNYYGYDGMGQSPEVVDWHRSQGRAPCVAQWTQLMKIKCNNASGILYKSNPITYKTNLTNVEVSRDGVSVSRIYY